MGQYSGMEHRSPAHSRASRGRSPPAVIQTLPTPRTDRDHVHEQYKGYVQQPDQYQRHGGNDSYREGNVQNNGYPHRKLNSDNQTAENVRKTKDDVYDTSRENGYNEIPYESNNRNENGNYNERNAAISSHPPVTNSRHVVSPPATHVASHVRASDPASASDPHSDIPALAGSPRRGPGHPGQGQEGADRPQDDYLPPLSATPPANADTNAETDKPPRHRNGGNHQKHDGDSGIAGFSPETYRENEPLDR